MKIILLGTAAGGGFPQWNCWCPTCRTARGDPAAAHPRTQSSAAVSGDGTHWFLLNASPDIHAQLAFLPSYQGSDQRHIPVEGVVFTDAELDHTAGLVLLREAGRLPVYASRSVAVTIERDSRVLAVMRAFAEVPLTVLPDGVPVRLTLRDGTDSGIEVEVFAVPGDAPRFAASSPKPNTHDGDRTTDAGDADAADGDGHDAGHTVGLLLRSPASCCAYVPSCGALDATVLGRLAEASVILFDGTFWRNDELAAVRTGARDALAMGHLPIGEAGGSLETLGALPARVVYVHINNTNPVLLERSAERAAVEAAGCTIGYDGMEIML